MSYSWGMLSMSYHKLSVSELVLFRLGVCTFSISYSYLCCQTCILVLVLVSLSGCNCVLVLVIVISIVEISTLCSVQLVEFCLLCMPWFVSCKLSADTNFLTLYAWYCKTMSWDHWYDVDECTVGFWSGIRVAVYESVLNWAFEVVNLDNNSYWVTIILWVCELHCCFEW